MNRHKKYTDKKKNVYCLEHKCLLSYNKKTSGYSCIKCYEDDARAQLEYLRGEIRAERISYGEIAELQTLAKYIQPDDVELLQWAGIPEFV